MSSETYLGTSCRETFLSSQENHLAQREFRYYSPRQTIRTNVLVHEILQ